MVNPNIKGLEKIKRKGREKIASAERNHRKQSHQAHMIWQHFCAPKCSSETRWQLWRDYRVSESTEEGFMTYIHDI